MTKSENQKLDATFYGFNQAVNRYLFSGTLTLHHATHIGSGRGDLFTDALVVVDANNHPIIPGSSLRGVFRSHIERLVSTLNSTEMTDLWACQLYEAELSQICIGSQAHQQSIDESKMLMEKIKANGLNSVWNHLPKKICSVCQLFGASAIWASKIRFTDLKLISDLKEMQIRHGVGINRDTGTAAPGVKYDKQVVEAGSQFKFEVIGENLNEQDRIILSLGLQALTNGELALGGSTTRGLGSCQLEDSDTAVQWVDFNQRQQFAEYLLKQEFVNKETIRNFVQRNLNLFFDQINAGGENAETPLESV